MTYEPKEFTIPAIQGISLKTIELHLGLYKGYVKHVNHLHDQLTKIAATDADGMNYAIQELRRRLGFEWNGMRLHELYFEALTPKAEALMGGTELYKNSSSSTAATPNGSTSLPKLSRPRPGLGTFVLRPRRRHPHPTHGWQTTNWVPSAAFPYSLRLITGNTRTCSTMRRAKKAPTLKVTSRRSTGNASTSASLQRCRRRGNKHTFFSTHPAPPCGVCCVTARICEDRKN